MRSVVRGKGMEMNTLWASHTHERSSSRIFINGHSRPRNNAATSKMQDKTRFLRKQDVTPVLMYRCLWLKVLKGCEKQGDKGMGARSEAGGRLEKEEAARNTFTLLGLLHVSNRDTKHTGTTTRDTWCTMCVRWKDEA